jgi:hypothetical protein
VDYSSVEGDCKRPQDAERVSGRRAFYMLSCTYGLLWERPQIKSREMDMRICQRY